MNTTAVTRRSHSSRAVPAWATTAAASLLLLHVQAATHAQQDPRIAARLEQAALSEASNSSPAALPLATRLDRLLFELGTLPQLAPTALFAAWQKATGEERAALALALSTCADAEMLTALVEAVAEPDSSPDHCHAHVLACARRLGIEASMPALRDLNHAPYRRQVADDLQALLRSSRGRGSRARTEEFLALFERAGNAETLAPNVAHLLLQRAIGLCGRLDVARIEDWIASAQRTDLADLQHAFWLALAFALNHGFCEDPASALASPRNTDTWKAAFDAALEWVRMTPNATPEQRIEAGFAAGGWPLDSEPELRCATLLEIAAVGAPWNRFHALRLLARDAGMQPDLDLVFFATRERAHPCSAEQTPAQREARLLKAVRSWAEERYPALKR